MDSQQLFVIYIFLCWGSTKEKSIFMNVANEKTMEAIRYLDSSEFGERSNGLDILALTVCVLEVNGEVKFADFHCSNVKECSNQTWRCNIAPANVVDNPAVNYTSLMRWLEFYSRILPVLTVLCDTFGFV